MLQQADIHLLEFINLHRISFLDPFFIFITNVATVITYSVPIILLIYAYSKLRFVLQRKSWLILITLTINSAIVDILKNVVNRPRPFITYPFIHNLVPVHSASFPSGHAAEVFMLAISLSLLFPKQKWRIAFGWAWALLIAYSRIPITKNRFRFVLFYNSQVKKSWERAKLIQKLTGTNIVLRFRIGLQIPSNSKIC